MYTYTKLLKEKETDMADLHRNANQRMIKENLWFLSFSGERNSGTVNTLVQSGREEDEKTATRFSYIYIWLGDKLPS